MKFGLAFIRSENDEQENEAFNEAAERIMRLPNFQNILLLPSIACNDQVVKILGDTFPSTLLDRWVEDIKSSLSETALKYFTDKVLLNNLMDWIEEEIMKEIGVKMGSNAQC